MGLYMTKDRDDAAFYIVSKFNFEYIWNTFYLILINETCYWRWAIASRIGLSAGEKYSNIARRVQTAVRGAGGAFQPTGISEIIGLTFQIATVLDSPAGKLSFGLMFLTPVQPMLSQVRSKVRTFTAYTPSGQTWRFNLRNCAYASVCHMHA